MAEKIFLEHTISLSHSFIQCFWWRCGHIGYIEPTVPPNRVWVEVAYGYGNMSASDSSKMYWIICLHCDRRVGKSPSFGQVLASIAARCCKKITQDNLPNSFFLWNCSSLNSAFIITWQSEFAVRWVLTIRTVAPVFSKRIFAAAKPRLEVTPKFSYSNSCRRKDPSTKGSLVAKPRPEKENIFYLYSHFNFVIFAHKHRCVLQNDVFISPEHPLGGQDVSFIWLNSGMWNPRDTSASRAESCITFL